MSCIINFFDHPFFMIMGGISTLVLVVGPISIAYLVVMGVIPVWWRLGIALSRNKIVIFACSDDYNSLKKILIDSNLFKEKNILNIGKKDINSAETADLLLVYWPDFKDKLDEVLRVKNHSVGLVVYAPREEGLINEPAMIKLNAHHNVTVTNFRGRLLNDVFLSMITTKRLK